MIQKRKNKFKKICKKIFCITLLMMILTTNIFATEEEESVAENITKSVSNTFELDEYVSTINEHVADSGIEGIDVGDIATSMLKNENVDYPNIISKLISFFSKEIMSAIRGAITIFIIVVIMAIISTLELQKNSDITKIAHLACFITLSTVTIATFIDTIGMFKNVVGTLTTLMQVISPFLMAVLISTGQITTTGIIQPMLLFIASAIGFIVNYVVIPFFSISVAFNVICSISENLRLDKLSKMFSSSAIWIVGIVLTLFLGVLSLETSLTSSVDSLAVKTTQTAVSNFVPVVGKFFSDSFETVVGATKVISNIGGKIGIVSIILIAIIPIIKIACIFGIYSLLAALTEPIFSDENVIKYINGFANVYKTLLGVLIGITILFVISTGIILNLANSVIK